MARFGLVGSDYTPQSIISDSQMTMNLYLELDESGLGKSAGSLYNTPGTKKLLNLANGQGRGIDTFQSRDFCVIGTIFYELTGTLGDLDGVQYGIVPSDGKPVCMAGGPTQVLVISAGQLYVFNLTSNTWSGPVAASVGGGNGLIGTPLRVRYLLGAFYLLVSTPIGNQIQQSNNLDGSVWPAINFSGIEVFSDNAIEIFENQLLLWVFGPKKTQPYEDFGNFPFALGPIQNALIEQGLAAVDSVCKADNSIFWLGADERGKGVIWRANGFTPQRVSTFPLEAEINGYTRIDDCISFCYQEAGHTFVVFHFPTADKTKVYDCANQSWHRRAYLSPQTGQFTRWHSGFHTFSQNLQAHITLDPTNGNIYQQSIQFLDDSGNPIKRVRRAPHISTEMSWLFHERLQLDMEVGIGPNFQGQLAPTRLPMKDASGVLRFLQVTELGVIQAPLAFGSPAPETVFINDSTNKTSWQVILDASGVIDLAPTALDTTYPRALSWVGNFGKTNWSIQVFLTGGAPILQAIARGIVQRGPKVTLRWSNDGGQSWSNPYDQDCGQQGQYLTRILWNRLGRARDRVYEISMTDACAWRIIDGYVRTSGDREPLSRAVTELAKRA